MNELNLLMSRIGYVFNNLSLLTDSVTHSSYRHENRKSVSDDNERLEFLGDALLDFVVGEELYRRFPEKGEGFLSRLRAEIVNEKNLSMLSRRLGVGSFLRLGRGEDASGGREKNSLLADAFESIIAAVYLDGGIDKARDFISRTVFQCIDTVAENHLYHDYKTTLQELLHKRNLNPEYRLIESSGPDHSPVFRYALIADGEVLGEGESSTKKGAQQKAAQIALERLQKENLIET